MAHKDPKVISPGEPHALSSLFEKPLIRIRPGRPRIGSDLAKLWVHRELFYFLIWRDLKVQYKETWLGAAWAILQPLLMAVVFTVFMNQLVHVPSGGAPYPIFVYSGVLPWLFLSNAIQSASYSLISNGYILTKVYLPRLIIPLAVVGVRLVDFLVASVVLLVLMLYYGLPMRRSIVMWPFFTLEISVLALGLGVWSSAVNTRYRDFGALLTVLLQVWMFASPIIYPSQLVPEKWRLLYTLNPVVGIVEGIRSSLFGAAFDWSSILISAFVTLGIAACAIRAFCRMDDNIVDIL